MPQEQDGQVLTEEVNMLVHLSTPADQTADCLDARSRKSLSLRNLQQTNPIPVSSCLAISPWSITDSCIVIPTNGHVSQRAREELLAPMVGPLRPGDPSSEGPSVGPLLPPTSSVPEELPEVLPGVTPQSPHSAQRSLIRDLTLPPLPNLDIPPSPPRSPSSSTDAKFAHFLELKKKGVHFNEKLANSAALKNPSLMQKLMKFADVDEQAQYATTLPKELWDPSIFPVWGYKEELGKSQQLLSKKREEEKARGQREAVEFVAASAPGDSNKSAVSSGLGGKAGGRKSAAERIMAGLERTRPGSPQVQAGMKRKTRFES